jgi:radical SAM superfamily enzyme YgiQ (UPF0313 family)
MRTLLLYPTFPPSFWIFEKHLRLQGKKALLPPLSLITVAAILPQDWEFKLVDRSVSPITEAEWEWAELVIISGMVVQQDDLLDQIREAKRRGKPVAVGGAYVTSTPKPARDAGADYLILDEGEVTLPLFVKALERGETSGVFRATEKPDVSQTPVPRYDLLGDLQLYQSMSVQFSRGCPYQCEFCDIIVLYGRKTRTKSPSQLIQELEYLYDLGWRSNVMLTDDNFIGNKRNVRLLLQELKTWQAEHDYPFSFYTVASIDLAKDPELMEEMVDCNFWAVFIGIETPDEESLKMTQKFQNLRDPLLESIDTILRAGLQIQAGLIMGFDGEKTGASDRLVQFMQAAGIPVVMFGLLQALPNTALWYRLQKEGRLLDVKVLGNESTLMNFIPTRPIEKIAEEYVEAFWQIYDPINYLDRLFTTIVKINSQGSKHKHRPSPSPVLSTIQLIAVVLWKYGVALKTRWRFWKYFWTIFRNYPDWLGGYLMGCAQLEHFMEFRETVRDHIQEQLVDYHKIPSKTGQVAPELVQLAG